MPRSARIAAIDASKAQPLTRLLNAIGIRHVGAESAKLLARSFGTMDALAAASVEELEALHGIGRTMAEAVHGWFRDPVAQALLAKFRAAGLRMDEPRAAAADGAFKGLKVVLTGTLPTLSRQQASANLALVTDRIPATLWSDLRAAGLISPDVPVPAPR